MSDKPADSLSKEDSQRLKKVITGQIRNLLANEFGIKSKMTTNTMLRQVLREIVADTVKAETIRHLQDSKDIYDLMKSQIASQIKKMVAEEIQKNFAPLIEDAVSNSTLSIKLEPFKKSENFGQF